MDEVRLYNRSLSDAEILEEYNYTLTGASLTTSDVSWTVIDNSADYSGYYVKSMGKEKVILVLK